MPRTPAKTAQDAAKAGPKRSLARGRPDRLPARENVVETVMSAAKASGLLSEKSSRIAGRVSPALVERAKQRTGIEENTKLIAFALANVALEDSFSEAFKSARGKVDPDLKLGY